MNDSVKLDAPPRTILGGLRLFTPTQASNNTRYLFLPSNKTATSFFSSFPPTTTTILLTTHREYTTLRAFFRSTIINC